MLMKKNLFLWFIALVCILASCSKDDGLNSGMDPDNDMLKSKPVNGPMVVLPPSGGDDTDALLDAVNSAAPGTTIQLAAGVYHIGYIEIHGFNGCIKGAGRDKTTISPAELIEVVPQAERNLLPTWWRIIGGDVKLSDLAFKTGDGTLLADAEPYYGKVLPALLTVNNYNADYHPNDPQPMNFDMYNVDFICGAIDPALGYLGEPYNVLMTFWVGMDVYWPNDPFYFTSGTYNIVNCYVENAFQGYEAFSLGENAVLTIDRCRTDECPYGIFCAASFNSKMYLTNNTLKNTKFYGIWVTDTDFGLLGNSIVPFSRCEYVITGNTFNPLPGSISLLMVDERVVSYPDIYFPLLTLVKNNLFNLTEGSIGVSCMNSVDPQIRNNRFTGLAGMGVYVDGAEVYDIWTVPPTLLGMGEAKNALILGNNFSGLTTTEGDIVLGENSFDCTLVGNGKESVIDLGTNNKIVGMKMMPGGNHAGPTIRDNFRMMPNMRHHAH